MAAAESFLRTPSFGRCRWLLRKVQSCCSKLSITMRRLKLAAEGNREADLHFDGAHFAPCSG